MNPTIESSSNGAANDEAPFLLGIVGGKGGQGTSMLASALAGAASRGKKVVLLDLDGNSSHRHLLDRGNCPGISNLAMVVDELTSRDIGAFIQRHPHGFDLLPGARNPEEERALDQVKFSLIVKLLSEIYEVIILDTSSSHPLFPMGLLGFCSFVILVVRPDLLSLSCAARLYGSPDRRDSASPAPWGIVVNHERPSGMVRPHQVSEVLGLPLLAILPEDPRAGEDFSSLAEAASRRTPYWAGVEALAGFLGFSGSRRNLSSRSFSSRCLRALRARSVDEDHAASGGRACAG